MSNLSHSLLPQSQIFQTVVCQVIGSSLVYVPLRLDLVVVRQAVDFVNEDLELDARVDMECLCHCGVELR